ncbi:MAG: Fur family transcriptional regulator [Desulfobacteraceae bacterium]
MSEPARHRMTRQRRVILEVIKQCGSHPTADEIYEMVRKRIPHISLGTVYRNLDFLSSSGWIRKIGPEHSQMRFDGNTRDHYHMTCIGCGRIEDLPLGSHDDIMETLERALGKLTKYGVFGHKLDFFGLCSACRKERGDLLAEVQDNQEDNEEEWSDGTKRQPN